MTAEAARTHFDELVSWAAGGLEADEVLTAWFSGEDSDFVRFNDGAIRQAGSVAQRSITIDLIMGDVHTGGSLQLAQDVELDRRRIERLLAQLRQQRELVSSDPYLSYATDGASSERIFPGALPAPADAIDEIRHAAADRDLVGIYAAGDTFHGFANSLGQRNWSQSTTFNLDWSFYLEADKAVKSLYAGQSWDSSALATKVERASQQLAVMGREPIDLAPGAYRTYLTPAALTELVGLLAWGGFGLRSHRTKRTPLLKMITEGAAMAPSVHLAEDTAGGIGPDFQAQGFLRPEQVKLIDGGRYADCLVSPRSAREYGVVNNGADDYETPLSLAMQPGQLPTS